MKKKFSAIGLALLTLVGIGLSARATTFSQKALVYCPPSDSSGCEIVIAALQNADRGYDGSNGTIDLRSADLSVYAVLVIPSFADNGDVRPYSLLRDSVVSAHLRASILGRRVFYSGTPDQGSSNRDAKNALMVRLAEWAGGNHVTVGAPGLVVLQDGSTSGQYDWVRGITGINVIVDPAIRSYSSVRAVTETGSGIIGDAAYTNMAARGFFLPEGAAGISLDAVGQTGTTVGGQIVLMTHPGATEHQAVVATDRDDYEPGATVTITGSGYLAGESVVLSFREDPVRHDERSFTVTADANGSFMYTGFAPEEHDLDVRFILTATGETSGRVAQTTFTDAITRTVSGSVGMASGGVSSLPVPAPAVVAGDVLIAQITITDAVSGTTICGPEGWSLVLSNADTQNKVKQAIFRRAVHTAAVVNSPHSFFFRSGACPSGGGAVTEGAMGHIIRYSGVDTANVINASGFHAGTSSGETFTTPVVTTTVADAMVIRFVSVFKNITINPGTARLYSDGANDTERAAAAWDGVQATAGNTAPFAATGASAEWIAHTIALRPAVVAPVGPTKLAFTSSAHSGAVNACLGPINIQTQDASSVATNVTSNTTVALATNGTGTFYSDNSCATPITSVAINTGASAATFYYKATTRGTGSHELSISATGLAGANQTQTINKLDQTIDFAELSNKSIDDVDFTVSATATSLLTVSFSSLTTGTCNVSGTTVSIDAVGTCTIRASQAGNGDYNAAPNVDRSFTIGKAAGSVTINNIPVGAVFGGSFTPAYTKLGDGNASTASLTTGVCTVSGGVVSFIATGQCDLQASVEEGTNHQAATGGTQTFMIGRAAGSVSINNIPVGAVFGGSFTPEYTKAGDGTASTASLTTGVCTVSGGVVSFIATGQCDLQASVTQGTNHLAATGGTQSFIIGKAAGSVTINNLPVAAAVGGSFTPAYTALGDGTTSTASLTTGVCTVSGGVVSYIAAGQCQLQASITAGTNHLAATGGTQSFTIGKAAGSVSINNLPAGAILGGSFTPTYTKLGDGTASTASLTMTKCTVDGTTGVVSFIAAGQCQLQASVTEGTNHLAATGGVQTFDIGKGTPTFTFDLSTLPAKTFGDAPFSVTSYAITNSTGAITFALGASSTGCTVSSAGLVTITAAATGSSFCVIAASLASDANYNAAGPLSQQFNIAKATPTFTFNLSALPAKTFGNAPFSVASYATTNSGGTISFALGTGSVGCTVTGVGQVTITGAAVGTNFCVIEATLAPTANYLGAGPLSQQFNIAKAATSLLYTGTQIVNIGTNVTLSATLSSAVASCKSTQPIVFTLTPETGTPLIYNATTNSSGVASISVSTSGWASGVYEVRVDFAGTANCSSSFDEATLMVAEPGQSATGGGWYTLSGSGRVNFGFNVKLVNGTGGTTGVPAQYRGQLLLINNAKWRCKGRLTSYGVVTTTNTGASQGTCDLQYWDLTANGGLGAWALAQTQASVGITFKPGNAGKKAVTVASFGASISHSPVSPQPSVLPNSGLTSLKGGDIHIR